MKDGEYVYNEYIKLLRLINKTSQLYLELLDSNEPLKIQYNNSTQYMYLVQQKDQHGQCVGVYWRQFCYVGSDRNIIWKKAWNIKHVPKSVLNKMSYKGYVNFKLRNYSAKCIYKVRCDLVNKKLRILGTLQYVASYDSSRVDHVENIVEEGMLDEII